MCPNITSQICSQRYKAKKLRKLTMAILLTAFVTGCSMQESGTPGTAGEVEALMSQYYDNIAAYDFAAMRAVYTSDFEILDDGYRFDADGFEELVRDIESRGATWDFSLSDFNTEVTPGIAYTSYVIESPPDFKWFGAATLVRANGEWQVDRMTMMGQAEPESAQ